jgi:hypothetical protein
VEYTSLSMTGQGVGWTTSPNKALQLTSAEHIERSQLNAGVGRLLESSIGVLDDY